MNNSRRENLLSILLIFLIILLIFQANYLWLKFSSKNEKIEPKDLSEEIHTEVLMPSRLVLNYGARNHVIQRNFYDIWKEHSHEFSRIIENATEENLKAIKLEEYLNLQDKESIVFKFSGTLSGSILINLLGNSKNNGINISVDSIYISKNNEVYVKGSESCYKLDGIKTDIDVENILNTRRDRGTNFINFKEAFGINKDILIPENNRIKTDKIYYTSGTESMEKRLKNNIAERFLETPIDYIREISQIGSINYVYENKFLSISDNGIIEYQNQEQRGNIDRNLYESLLTATDFISKKTGLTSGIFLEKIKPIDIENGAKKGYRFYFNYKETQTPLILNSEKNSFIELEVYKDFVKSYREVYLKKIENPSVELETLRVKNIKDVVEKNLEILKGQSTEEVLKNINAVSIVYLSGDEDTKKLKLHYEVSYKDRLYYFNISSGKFIRKR